MQMRELSRTLMRRWYLTLASLLATGALCVVAFSLVPPTYETKADVVLLPPKSSVGVGGNPYLYLGGLDQATDVLTRALTSDSSRNQVLSDLGHSDYDVEPDWATSGPILIVTGRGATAAGAEDVRDAVIELAPQTLVSLQSGLDVPTNSRITSMVLTADEEPTTVFRTTLRALAAVGVVSLTGFAMLIGLVDGLLAARARRRSFPGVVSEPNVGDLQADRSPVLSQDLDLGSPTADASPGPREGQTSRPSPSADEFENLLDQPSTLSGPSGHGKRA